MKIVINNNTFTEAGWSVSEGIGTLDLYVNISLIDVLTLLGNNPTIYVYDDEDTLLSMWATNSVKGIKDDVIFDRRRITVTLDASILTNNAEEVLNTNLNNSIDGILELAQEIDNLDKTMQTANEDISNLRNSLIKTDETVSQINNKFAGLPDNMIARFDALWTSYNALADRIATIENHLS